MLQSTPSLVSRCNHIPLGLNDPGSSLSPHNDVLEPKVLPRIQRPVPIATNRMPCRPRPLEPAHMITSGRCIAVNIPSYIPFLLGGGDQAAFVEVAFVGAGLEGADGGVVFLGGGGSVGGSDVGGCGSAISGGG